MKTLIVSDIHGNFAALEAIAATERFDDVICLGDIVGYGPEPAACLRWLRQQNVLIVQGNHDRALGEGAAPGCTPQFQWLAEATRSIGEGQLTADERVYLAALPRSAVLERDGVRYMLVHATPNDPLYGYREATVDAWKDELRGVKADVVLVGHKHLQFELRVDATRLVNPGSAGQPKDGDPRAAYAVLEDGALRFGRVAYPIERTITMIARAGVSSAAVGALGDLLRTGRVPTAAHDAERPPRWLTRVVLAMTATSFLSDAGHEAQSTLLPSFMAALGLPPAVLGAVEGIADAASSFVKLGAGWFSDRLGVRKTFVVGGYLATGLASGIIAMANGLPLVLGGKLFGWLGRGVRGPLRDAMLADAIPAEARGRAFGFHRFGDTLGAIVGPLAAVWLLARFGGADTLHTTRVLLAWSLVPGVLAGLTFALFVSEHARTPFLHRSFRHALRDTSTQFRRYLVGVGIFGAGDYAHTMLILAATQLLTPRYGMLHAAALAGGLYVIHNVIYAAAAYPAGVLADRYGHRRVLAVGYAISVAVPLAVIACFAAPATAQPILIGVFVVAGLVNGIQDTLESAATAELVPAQDRGIGFGLLGAVNGVGDLMSSAIVGLLWTAHPALGFGYAALCMGVGAGVTFTAAA
jgi:putative phosphoesterase